MNRAGRYAPLAVLALVTSFAAAQPKSAVDGATRGCPPACTANSVINAAGEPELRVVFDTRQLPADAIEALRRSDLPALSKAMKGRPVALAVQADPSLRGAAARADVEKRTAALRRVWQQAGLPADQLRLTAAAAR